MKHIRVYEESMFTKIERNEKYLKFIKDKFEIKNIQFGNVELDAIHDEGIKISLKLGKIKSNKLLQILNFFKSCEGEVIIPINGGFFYYSLFLSNEFLEYLNTEIDALKYNI